MNKGHALITGGAGFIGSHLCDRLLKADWEVTALDCLSPQVHADAELDDEGWPVYLDRRVRRIRGDVLDDGVLEAALTGVTHVTHLAASVGVGQSMTNIVDYTRNNTLGAAVLLEVLSRRRHTVERLVVASSMSIYGEGAYRRGDTLVAPEPREAAQLQERRWEMELDGETLTPLPTPEDKPLQPSSIYAINKRDHEEMFLAVGRALQIPTVALRLFNVYGSRQALSNPYTGVAAIFIGRLLNDEAPLIFEDGEQKRDFVHVQDVADAFAAALEDDARLWAALNIGSGEARSVRDIAETLAHLLGKDIAPRVLNRFRVGDVRHCFADISHARKVLGFRPKRAFGEGMAELIDWVSRVAKPTDRSAESMARLVESKLLV